MAVVKEIIMHRQLFTHVVWGAVALAVAAFPGIVHADPPCGSGPHWIDTCGGGDDNFSGTAGVHTIEIFGIGTFTSSLAQQGDFIVSRSDPLDDSLQFPGLRPTDGHFDVIDTEIVQLTLSSGGITMTVGSPFNPVLTPTLGTIAEDPGNSSLGNSFFDVFFELDLGGGFLVYNQTAVRMESTIPGVPPDLGLFPHVFLGGPIALFDDPLAGNQVGLLFEATHLPAPGAALLALLGLPMVGWVKRRFAY